MKEENQPKYIEAFRNSKLYADGYWPSDLVILNTQFDESMKLRTLATAKSKYVKCFLDKFDVCFNRQKTEKESKITRKGSWIGKEEKDEDIVMDTILTLSEVFYCVLGKQFDILPSGKKERKSVKSKKQVEEVKEG